MMRERTRAAGGSRQCVTNAPGEVQPGGTADEVIGAGHLTEIGRVGGFETPVVDRGPVEVFVGRVADNRGPGAKGRRSGASPRNAHEGVSFRVPELH